MDNEHFKPEDYVWRKDANLSGIPGVLNCFKHGNNYSKNKFILFCKIA